MKEIGKKKKNIELMRPNMILKML